jgi:ABC-type amino acid transport system permease subunit
MRVPNRLGRGLATGFVEVVRNIPLLVGPRPASLIGSISQ